jgi:hypothetical protein
MIRLTPSQITVDAGVAGELPRRSISGIAVTYDETATVADGTKVRIMQGALPVTGRAPKLYGQHDSGQIIGILTERVDTAIGHDVHRKDQRHEPRQRIFDTRKRWRN